MKKNAKNYINIVLVLMLLYFAFLSILAAHEDRADLERLGQSVSEANMLGWYVLIFVLGALAALAAGWFVLSRKNSQPVKETIAALKDKAILVGSFAAGGAMSLLVANLAIGSLPSFQLAPGSGKAREEPTALSESSESSQSSVSSEEPAAEVKPEDNIIASARGVMIIEGTKTVSSEIFCTTPNASTLLVWDHAALTIEQTTIRKSGDAADSKDALQYGLNAAVLGSPGATINALGGGVISQANGSAAFAVNGENASLSTADVKIRTEGPSSPAVLSVYQAQARVTGGTLNTTGENSAAFKTGNGGSIQEDSSIAQTDGANSPVIESAGTFTGSGLNAAASQSAFASLLPGGSISLTGSSFSSGCNLNGRQGMFIVSTPEGEDNSGRAALNLDTCTFNPNPAQTDAANAPMLLVDGVTADVTMRANTMPAFTTIARAEGATLSLKANSQILSGKITANESAALNIDLNENTILYGSINSDGLCPNVSLHLDASSKISMFGDLYLNEFANDDSTNSNILTNGFHVYVNGQAQL